MSATTNSTLESRKLDLERRRLKRRVPPEERKRTAAACETCKRKKKKCDGCLPCQLCSSRSLICQYSSRHQGGGPKSPASPSLCNDSGVSHDGTFSPINSLGSEESSKVDTSVFVNSPDCVSSVSTQIGGIKRSSESGSDTVLRDDGGYFISAESKEHRLLRTDGGNRYIGESCTLSLINQIRRLFRHLLGKSTFTEDPERFNFAEATPPKISRVLNQLPAESLAIQLLNAYEQNIHRSTSTPCGLHSVCDIRLIYRNPLSCSDSLLCIAYFVFAIGALFYRPEDSQTPWANMLSTNDKRVTFAESSFECGMKYVDEDSSDSSAVQINLLQSTYYELVSRRNLAWIALAKAIRCAQSLGFSAENLNMYFPRDEAAQRKSLIRGLFVSDTLESVILGRPPMLTNIETRDELDKTDDELYSLYIVKLCKIIYTIYNDIYQCQKIYRKTAQQCIENLKEWAASFESMARNKYKDRFPPGELNLNPITIAKCLPWDRVLLLKLNCTYFYAIILVTRPFLLYTATRRAAISIDASKDSPNEQDDPSLKEFDGFSSACVRSAAGMIELIRNAETLPNRCAQIVNYVFTSSVILLLDAFQSRMKAGNHVEYSMKWAIVSGMKTLASYANESIHASRYLTIVAHMHAEVFKKEHKAEHTDANTDSLKTSISIDSDDLLELFSDPRSSLFSPSINQAIGSTSNDFNDPFDLNFLDAQPDASEWLFTPVGPLISSTDTVNDSFANFANLLSKLSRIDQSQIL